MEQENIQGDASAIIEANKALEAQKAELEVKLAEKETAISQITARAKRAEEEAREYKSKAPTDAKPEDPYKSKFEDLELKVEGFSDEEVAFLKPLGGREAMKSPHVKAAIETIRAQKKAEANIPEGDSGKSDIERKYTQEQLRGMSAEELYKILPKA